MTLDISTKTVQKMLVDAIRDMPYISMLAINDMAFDAKDSLKKSMLAGLEIEKASLANAFRIKKAKKTNLTAVLFVNKDSWQYKALEQHYEGGDRARKGMELMLQSMGAIKKSKILIPMAKIRKRGYSDIKNALNSKAKSDYFLATKTAKKTAHLNEGIYARVNAGHKVVGIMMIRDKPNYKKRFDITSITEKVVNRRFEQHFNIAFKRAIKTR